MLTKIKQISNYTFKIKIGGDYLDNPREIEIPILHYYPNVFTVDNN